MQRNQDRGSCTLPSGSYPSTGPPSQPRGSFSSLSDATGSKRFWQDFRSVTCGEGWPRETNEPGSPPWRLSLKLDVEVNWLVTLEGVTIGDCFTHGGADAAGDIEIGYGLAAPYRGNGYGTELVAGLAGWLILHPEIDRVVATNVDANNTPSRRALERAGFVLEDDDGVHVRYAFAPR